MFAACVCTLVTGDTQSLKIKEKKPIPSALEVLESCNPSVVHTIGPIRISPARAWILTHSKHCLGHKDIISAISVGGDYNIDKDLSVAVAKGYVHALKKNKQANCSFDIIRIPEIDQESDGVTTYMYPFILSCNDIK